MAIDTRNRRFAMMGLAGAPRLQMPAPDGTLAQADRQQFLYGYPGILWEEEISGVICATLSIALVVSASLSIAHVASGELSIEEC